MQRTYSRKGTRHATRSALGSPEHSPQPAQPRKKRRIEVEVVTDAHLRSSALGVVDRSLVGSDSWKATPSVPENRAVNPRASNSRHATSSPAKKARSPVPPVTGSTKDKLLTTLFDSSQPLNRLPSHSAGGVAKRMLRRTRTESSVGDGSALSQLEEDTTWDSRSPRRISLARTESVIDLTADSPRSRTLSPQKTSSRSQQDLSSSPGKPIRPSIAASNVRTYAGKSRSFLVAFPNSSAAVGSQNLGGPSSQHVDDEILAASQEDDIDTIRESYTDLRLRWGVDNSEDDAYPTNARATEGGPSTTLPPNMMNDLKSISELRNRGETRRFLDEMGYLFEGLDPSGSLGVRRGSALEIVTKLCDEDFARRAKAGDFLGRAWDIMRAAGAGDGDKVLDTILLLFAALVARDSIDLSELTAKSGFVDKLFGLLCTLERKNDPLWLISAGLTDAELRRAGITRAEKTTLTSLHRMTRKQSGLFRDSEIISSRLLVSTTLSQIPPSSCSPAHLTSLVSSLTSELRRLPQRIYSYVSGLPLFPRLDGSTHTEIATLSHVDHLLQLLDSCLLGRWQTNDEGKEPNDLGSERTQDLQQSLAALCVAADVLSREECDQSYHFAARRCLESLLRVLINLTHDSQEWCEGLLRNEMLLPTIIRLIAISHRERLATTTLPNDDAYTADGSEEKAAALLDRLCLSLGLFTNLVQVADEVKDRAADINISPECSGKRKCTAACSCPSRVDAVTFLAGIYAQQCKSTHDLDSVVRGHMAILFGLLLQDHSKNQRLLLKALPGTSNRNKLRSLVEHAEDFTSFYIDFAKRVAESQSQSQGFEDEEENDDRGEEESHIGRPIRDTKGEAVARNAIAFLEELQRCTYD